jgi:hypothetical protein
MALRDSGRARPRRAECRCRLNRSFALQRSCKGIGRRPDQVNPAAKVAAGTGARSTATSAASGPAIGCGPPDKKSRKMANSTRRFRIGSSVGPRASEAGEAKTPGSPRRPDRARVLGWVRPGREDTGVEADGESITTPRGETDHGLPSGLPNDGDRRHYNWRPGNASRSHTLVGSRIVP